MPLDGNAIAGTVSHARRSSVPTWIGRSPVARRTCCDGVSRSPSLASGNHRVRCPGSMPAASKGMSIVCTSSRRDEIPNFSNTLCRWYSTVRGLR